MLRATARPLLPVRRQCEQHLVLQVTNGYTVATLSGSSSDHQRVLPPPRGRSSYVVASLLMFHIDPLLPGSRLATTEEGAAAPETERVRPAVTGTEASLTGRAGVRAQVQPTQVCGARLFPRRRRGWCSQTACQAGPPGAPWIGQRACDNRRSSTHVRCPLRRALGTRQGRR